MNSKERIISCWNGIQPDHIPLATQCFGFTPKPSWHWIKEGKPVNHWYSLRLEHIHTLPDPWGLEDDFKRVEAWLRLGMDDILDVSVPWSMSQGVQWQDTESASVQEERYPVMIREYDTPSGKLRHAVKKTGEEPGEGWVIQPDYVPLFEDYNIPRAVEHAVSKPEDISAVRHLYTAPDSDARTWFSERMEQIAAFAGKHGVAVQAWSSFGMDGLIWLTGVEGAILMALEHPEAFRSLLDIIIETDYKRTELACHNPAIDMVVQRGWYSSTDFWSPKLLDEFLFPSIAELAQLAHNHGKKFGYVMTTGIEILGRRLANAGVDVLYFVDPVQDKFPLERARDILGKDMTIVGGTNSVTLASGDEHSIREEVKRALDIFTGDKRFILSPVDALFPDTPWKSVEILIDTWKNYR